MLTTTIVPLDGDAKSEVVLPSVAGIARSTGGRLVLLTVLGPDDAEAPSGDRFNIEAGKSESGIRSEYSGLPGVSGVSPSIPREDGGSMEGSEAGVPVEGDRTSMNTLTAARLYLERVAAPLRDAGISVEAQVVEGEPVRQIFDAIERESADTVALATHHSSAIARTFKGSVTDEVVRTSPVPVLSMHAGERETVRAAVEKPSTLIVPLDGSELSEAAIEPAWELAKKLDADIVFVRSATGPEDMAWSAAAASTAGAVPESESEIQEDVEDYLRRFIESSRSQGFRAEARRGSGPPAEVIINEAQRHPAAMIVMSTHGASGLKRALLGSVTDEVVRKSEQPVLVVSTGDTEMDAD